MASLAPSKTALLVIDTQKAFEEIAATGLPRNNLEAEGRIARLLSAFREGRMPVIHVRHASLEAESRFRPERPGYQPSDWAAEQPGETVIVKNVNSAFIGTNLEVVLHARGIDTLVITGATTNHCVETTTRMAGNLGFDAKLVRDATWTFERTGPDGEHHSAEATHAMTLANLSGEFAEIVTTQDILDRILDRMANAPAAGSQDAA